MARLLDRSKEDEVARTVADALEEAGYEPQEAIPGLVQAIVEQANLYDGSGSIYNRAQALDEAADLLADA